MLTRAGSYDALRQGFRWDIPVRLNMAAQACDTWAAREPGRSAIIDLSEGARKDWSYAMLQALSKIKKRGSMDKK